MSAPARFASAPAKLDELRSLQPTDPTTLRAADAMGAILNAVDPQDLTTREAALYTGLSESTLARYRKKGGGPAYTQVLRGKTAYKPADLDKWMRRNNITAPTREMQVAS